MNICEQHGLKNHDKNEALDRAGTGMAIAGTATKKRTIVRKTNCFLHSGGGRTATGGTLLFFIFSLLFVRLFNIMTTAIISQNEINIFY